MSSPPPPPPSISTHVLPACEACYKSKVKCVRDPVPDAAAAATPLGGTNVVTTLSNVCRRCQRLGIECIPRTSRQGQGGGPKTKGNKSMQKGDVSTTMASASADGNSKKKGKKKGTTSTRAAVRKRRRQRRQLDDNGQDEDYMSQFTTTEDSDGDDQVEGGYGIAARSEDETVARQIVDLKNKKQKKLRNVEDLRHHYGVQYLIHSWINFAFTRRSMKLLGRACSLAAKCQIPMDDIFCRQKQQTVLTDEVIFGNGSTINNRSSTDTTSNSRTSPLKLSDVPSRLLEVCRCTTVIGCSTAIDDSNHITDPSGTNTPSTASWKQRYILIREAVRGQSHYWISDRFSNQICSLWTIESTWKSNTRSVVSLYLNSERDFDKFTTAINYQMSRYSDPTIQPRCIRMNNLKVKFKSGQIQTMDLIYAFEIINLDHSFYFSEFVPSSLSAPSRRMSSPTRTENHDGALQQQQHAQQQTMATSLNDRSIDDNITDTNRVDQRNAVDTTNNNNNEHEGIAGDGDDDEVANDVVDPLPLFDDLVDGFEMDDDFELFLSLINDDE